MNPVAVVMDYHDNEYNQPTEEEFWSWTNKQRHDFIKKDAGAIFKSTAPGLWCYLFYPRTDLCIRSMVNRKKEIIRIETSDIEEGNLLMRNTANMINAFSPNIQYN